MELVDLRK